MTKQEKLIAEIHNEFDTAQERLLSQAHEVLKSININAETSLELVADRLAKIGFINTPVVKSAGKIKEDKKQKQEILVKTKEEAELIEYYRATYPFLKFLTESELDRICAKYELIHAPVGNYTKDVPEKNLREIESSQKLKITDTAKSYLMVKITQFWHNTPKRIRDLVGTEFVYDGPVNSNNEPYDFSIKRQFGITDVEYIFRNATVTRIEKSGLFIAAPPSHFNLEGLTKKSKHGFFQVFKTEITDPIVFRYVRGGVQVLSKWGLEANDPSLVVPVLN